MTREQQITVVKEMILEAVADGSMTKRCATAIMNAYDALLALPLEVPGDEEIEIEYPTSLPVLCSLHDIPIKFNAEQGRFLSHMRDNNDLKQRGAKWMRDEIIKRNRP